MTLYITVSANEITKRELLMTVSHHHHHHHRCMLDVGHCPLYPDRSIRGRALLYS